MLAYKTSLKYVLCAKLVTLWYKQMTKSDCSACFKYLSSTIQKKPTYYNFFEKKHIYIYISFLFT